METTFHFSLMWGIVISLILAAVLLTNTLTEHKFEVHRPATLHLQELLQADSLQEIAGAGQTGEVDLAALDAIEDQLTDSAMQFQGEMPELEMGEVDMEDRLF